MTTPADVAAVTALRPQLRAVWQASGGPELAGLVNRLLRDSDARPWLVDHGGGWGWHLHVTEPAAPLAQRIGAQAGFALATWSGWRRPTGCEPVRRPTATRC